MTDNPHGRPGGTPHGEGPPPVGPPATGYPSPPPYPYPYPPGVYPPPPPGAYPGLSAPRNGLGTAALVVAVIALIGSFSVVGGIVGGVVAVVLGLVGRARVKRGEATNGGVALAGVILGVFAIVIGLVFVAVWLSLLREVGAKDYFDCLQRAGQDRAQVQQCAERFRQSVEDRFAVTERPVR